MKPLTSVLILLLVAPIPAAALDTEDLLSLVAMPLAVAAVADLIEVPTDTLVSVVTALNQADVPPPQFIEVVRYVPVVLVDADAAPEFVTFVTSQVQQGVVGNALAVAIANQLRAAGATEINVTAPRVVLVEREPIIPPVVVTRVAQVKAHPHGGPPGQVKKVLGVQTGAEVVHGTQPGRVITRDDDDDDDRRGRRVRGSDRDPRQVPAVVMEADRDKGKSQGRGRGQSGNPGKPDNSGKSKGKGKGR